MLVVYSSFIVHRRTQLSCRVPAIAVWCTPAWHQRHCQPVRRQTRAPRRPPTTPTYLTATSRETAATADSASKTVITLRINIRTSLPKVIWEEGRVAAKVSRDAVKSPLVTMARAKFAPKVLLPVDGSANATTCLIPGPVRPMMPNGIRIRSAVFHNALDRPTHRPTHRPTDRPRTQILITYRPLRSESDAA